MHDTDQERETYSDAETQARAEAALKRMLATPHKPHKTGEANARSERGSKKSPSKEL